MSGDPFSTPSSGHDGPEIRGGRYVVPDPNTGRIRTWQRVTNFAKILADSYALDQWRQRKVVEGMATQNELRAKAVAALARNDNRDEIQAIAEAAKESAGAFAGAELGSALHKILEYRDLGQDVHVPHILASDVAAYYEALERHGLAVADGMVEVCVLNLDYGVVGRLDRGLWTAHRPGLVVGDFKSGQNLDYNWLEIAVQIYLYASATHVWDWRTGEFQPMPEFDQEVGAVIHVPAGSGHGEVHKLNLVGGRIAAEKASEVREMRRVAKAGGLVEPWPTHDGASLAAGAGGPDDEEVPWDDCVATTDGIIKDVIAAQSVEELATLWDIADRHGLLTEDVKNALMGRGNEVEPWPTHDSATPTDIIGDTGGTVLEQVTEGTILAGIKVAGYVEELAVLWDVAEQHGVLTEQVRDSFICRWEWIAESDEDR